jgi:phage shock protein B
MQEMIPIVAILSIFVILPWMILHYRTRSKQARGLSIEDERMLDELHQAALRLDDRLQTIERIMTADNPEWRQIAASRDADVRIEDTRTADIRRLK